MKYILSIAIAVLFCCPATASAKYRLSQARAESAVLGQVIAAQDDYELSNDVIDPQGTTAKTYCVVAMSATKRSCLVLVQDWGSTVCVLSLTVEAHTKHNLVVKTRRNTCD